MTASSKYGWGLALTLVGWLAVVGGVALSVSLVGACVGIPMIIVGLPLGIWGAIWAYQGHQQKQLETLAAGIRDGIAASREHDGRV